MPSERMQRRIDAFLDEADEAAAERRWDEVAEAARAVLAIDEADEDALGFLRMAEANGPSSGGAVASGSRSPEVPNAPSSVEQTTSVEPDSFAGGRYVVQRFLGEGGKKRVYLAHDELLDRDVAFALIKTEGLDEVGRERVVREAQAMGRMGTHPHIVSIFDFGEHEGAPYVVTELMGGGDVEGLLDDADGPLPLARSLEIAKATARGLVFAHEQGVVHRDLKPGNVWLTSDGVAKIGDFGLAVAEGRSRLTQHGMMVGTFGYMPPEQALGQEVTPQADLYALGAMLYELVTGAPPFAGDDPTAVISQHINTAPVRPSLRSDHCPPDLEALILRLLAKAPADRPPSAAEVIAALEAVDPEARSATDSQLNPLDRLARGVFVGREAELERLRNAADEAFAGRGTVVTLVGEPGIGKTRTAQELETYARMRGAQVLWGRAHEASGAPAYWPWVQAGRAWGSANDPKALLGSLQGASDELVRLFPELPGILGQEPPDLPEVADESAQFRLFDAYARFLRAASLDSPLVVVLDDIHWADKPTLLLLRHLARELANMRLLVVGTYRDTELARTHPLSETLAELNREGGFNRVVLRGLAEPEVRAYVAATLGREPSADLVARIHDETEGNPFFLAEVVNLMTEEGSFEADSVSDIALPDGVREALGRRLDRLSDEANELLKTASVVGREFEYETLQQLADHDDETLLALLEKGLAARVIEELDRPGRYRFTHALMQETLLAELSTTRRVRLHGEIAEALERLYADRAVERASALAQHYVESSTLNSEHAEKARYYSRAAGEQAEGQAAWSEAARHYERALAVSDRHQDRASVETAFARTCALSGEYRAGWRAVMSAIDALRATGPVEDLARAVAVAQLLNPPYERAVALIGDVLERGAELDDVTRARLLYGQARNFAVLGRYAEMREAAAEAARLDGASRDSLVAACRTRQEAFEAMLAGEFADAGERFLASSVLWRDVGPERDDPEVSGHIALLTAGELERGEMLSRDYLARARSLGGIFEMQNTQQRLASVALLRCDFDQAREIEATMTGGESTVRYIVRVGLAEIDGATDLQRTLVPLELTGGVPAFLAIAHGLRARALLLANDLEGARSEVGEWARHARAWRSGFATPATIGMFGLVGRALPKAGDVATVRWAYELIRPLAKMRVLVSDSADVLRGELALELDLPNEAEEWFRSGLEWCERERCPVEAGRCLQGLAEVAGRRGGRDQAMEYLDRAGELFSRHGAKLYLDQVLAKKGILRA